MKDKIVFTVFIAILVVNAIAVLPIAIIGSILIHLIVSDKEARRENVDALSFILLFPSIKLMILTEPTKHLEKVI